MGNRNKGEIAIVTGPTGGHFFPALAIGEQIIKKYNMEVHFFVPARNYILQWLGKKEFYYRTIPEAKITFKRPFSFLRFIYCSFWAFYSLVKGGYKLVVITGSYTTLPFLLAAFLCNKKIFVHEQNVVPGKITKISLFLADRIGISFPSTSIFRKNKTVITGFPVLEDFKRRYGREEVLKEFNFNEKKKNILILGGSQGASFLNELIIENMDYLMNQNLQFIHLAGKEKEKLSTEYEKYGIKAKVFDFYFDMAKLYSITDLMISRAGAGTLAEICEWKIPAIVIPYPYAGGHQKYNAIYLASKGACIILEQNSNSVKMFPHIFEKLLKDDEIIKKNLERFSIVDERENNVQVIMELLENGRKYS